jgi:hypothetical protein
VDYADAPGEQHCRCACRDSFRAGDRRQAPDSPDSQVRAIDCWCAGCCRNTAHAPTTTPTAAAAAIRTKEANVFGSHSVKTGGGVWGGLESGKKSFEKNVAFFKLGVLLTIAMKNKTVSEAHEKTLSDEMKAAIKRLKALNMRKKVKETRGGARPGAGRKEGTRKRYTKTFTLTAQTLRQLRQLNGHWKVSRPRCVERAVDEAHNREFGARSPTLSRRKRS